MALQNILLQKRDAIIGRWLRAILATYPADTAKFLHREPNHFANPVGQTISEALGPLFDAIVQGAGAEQIQPHLDNVVHIRAVQDFSAAEAVRFVFDLKRAITEELQRAALSNGLLGEIRQLDQRIETVALQAFDIYMECREQVYQIKANALRRRTELLLERKNYVVGDPPPEDASESDRK